MKKKYFVLIFISFMYSFLNATTYYVSHLGNDTNNGLGWATAKLTIQNAINSATPGDSVFVAVGKHAGFNVKNGIHIFGGFTGTELYLCDRQKLIFGHLINGFATELIAKQTSHGLGYGYITIYCDNSESATTETIIDGFVMNSGMKISTAVYLRGNYTLKNCHILDSTTDESVFYNTGTPTIENVKIENAYSSLNFYNVKGTINIKKCIINNDRKAISIKASYSSANIVFKNCIISNSNRKWFGSSSISFLGNVELATIGNIDFVDCIFLNNKCVDSSSNSAITGIVAIDNSYNPVLRMNNCLFANNFIKNCYNANNACGVIVDKGSSNYLLQNCTFINNYAQHADSSKVACTIYSSRSIQLYNNIFWNNKGNTSQQLQGYNAAYTFFNAVSGQSLNGVGNIVLDTANNGNDSTKNYVRFVNPTNFTGVATNATDSLAIFQADWHLSAGSSCIDAGHPYQISLPYQNSTDFDGNHRVSGGRIDIGAYEFPQADAPQQIVWNQNLQGHLSEGWLVSEASTTSGLPLSYTSSNPGVATVSGDTILFHAVGKTTITATQWGDSVYMPATPLAKLLTVYGDTIVVQDTIKYYDTITTHIYDTLWTNDTLWHNDTIWFNDTIRTQIYDTLWSNDTLWTNITTYDTIPIYDTITIYVYDTVTIYDTIHITVYDTINVRIENLELSSIPWKITQDGESIYVSGAEGESVRIYDITGRCLHVEPKAVGVLRFQMYAAGVYLVQIGNYQTQKVVLTK